MSKHALVDIDGVPYNEVIWEYYSLRREMELPNDTIHAALYVLHPQLSKYKHYNDLPFYLFWQMFYEMYLIATDISHVRLLFYHLPIEDLKAQIVLIEKVSVYWALTKDHPINQILHASIAVPQHLMNRKRTGTSRAYDMEAYYMNKIIQQAFAKMCVAYTQIQFRLQDPIWEFFELGSVEDEPMDVEIKRIIRNAYQIDEFIFEVMDMATEHMTQDHSFIANLRGSMLMGLPLSEQVLLKPEIWRRLFGRYFDAYEDYFDKFYKTFRRWCIQHLFDEYLQVDLPWEYIPFYGLIVSNDDQWKRYVLDIRDILQLDKFKATMYRKYPSTKPIVSIAIARESESERERESVSEVIQSSNVS